MSHDGRCFEAVNIFYHQLTSVSRSAAYAAGLVLPLLPARGVDPRSNQPLHSDHDRARRYMEHTSIAAVAGNITQIVSTYISRSPCMTAHEPRASVDEDDNKQDTFQAPFSTAEARDTAVPGAGYVDCDAPDVCQGADVNYRMQAVVRTYILPGSNNMPNMDSSEVRKRECPCVCASSRHWVVSNLPPLVGI